MTHLVMLLTYDGTSYFGWQKTKHGPSIEAEVENVLQQVFQEPVALQAASRTDRGVHADGQVIDFFVSRTIPDLPRLVTSLNQLLPPDIRCLRIGVAPTEAFHPTLDVKKKQYRYSISTGPVQIPQQRFTHWHVYHPFDPLLLKTSAQLFIGTHDFRGLCNRRADLDEEHTVRTIFAINVTTDLPCHSLSITIEADHFLYKMARTIVGTMMWAAQGKLDIASIVTALTTRKRALAGVTAPAHGLTLAKVFYRVPVFCLA